MSKKVYNQIKSLSTESINHKTARIDRVSTRKILELINLEDRTVASTVKQVIPQIEKAVEIVVKSFKSGGRLLYVGAGTSGRLGVLDASECPPTYGVKPSLVQGVIAGGRGTLVRSREGVEDDDTAGKADIARKNITKNDTVIGIATSNRTPYTIAALKQARKMGANTIFLCCNKPVKLPFKPDLVINPATGPEVVAGSTRMKAGTATKLILNMITTTAMIKMGKTYGNLMVDLKATSQKLVQRSINVLMTVCDLNYNQAKKLLENASGHVKTAIVMQLMDTDLDSARKMLADAEGHLSTIIRKR